MRGNNVPVSGMASSADVRYPPDQEFNLESGRTSLACSWGNLCDFLGYSDTLDDATRTGVSVYKNIVSGTPKFITAGLSSIPNWPNTDHWTRDAISAVGLGGAPNHKGWYEYMYFVVAEGQTLPPGFVRGWRLLEVANFMISRLGVKEAVRLDSGGSSQLSVESFNLAQQRNEWQLNRRRRAFSCMCEPRPVRNLLTLRVR